jgi:lipopolysaccharide export system permease protein
MRGLTRYILRHSLMVMVFVTIAFTAAVWLVQSLRLVDLIVNRGLSVGLFAYLAALILPRLVDVVLPIAVFVAILFVYNKLIAESELVVMRATGMSSGALARPAVLVGIFATVVLYAQSLYLTPAANRAFKDLQFQIRNRFASVLVQEGVFNTVSDRLMVYVKNRDGNGDLASLLIYDMRDRAKPVTIFAERGAFVDTAEGPRILLVNGTRQSRDPASGRVSSLNFVKYTLDLAALNGIQAERPREPDERYMSELLWPEEGARAVAALELNLRLARPLAALAMALLPVACLLTGEFNRRGQFRRVMLAILLAFAMEVLDVGLQEMAAHTIAAIVLLYANLLLPVAAAHWLLWRDDNRSGRPAMRPAPAE